MKVEENKYMDHKESQIIQLLKQKDEPMTAMEIINNLYPGKPQPYINSTLNAMVDTGILIRNDSRPYTVELAEELLNNKNIINIDHISKISSKNVTKRFDRGDYLKKEFNDFWNEFFSTEQDYYSKMPFERLIKLKMAVRNINNLVTYESTIMAAKLIIDILNIGNEDQSKILTDIESTSENANGYDIEFHGNIPFICEVKANIPSGGKDVFGAQQKDQILKDFSALIYGKSKSVISVNELNLYYKFMCFYSAGEKTIHAVCNMINNLEDDLANRIEFFNGQETLSKDKVYVIYVVKE